jgi:eukaryotic-like serine/threonine-protein kinase
VGAELKKLNALVFSILIAVLLSGCGTALPDVKGMTLAAARNALAQSSFVVGVVSYDPSAVGATWTVGAQSPAEGERSKSGAKVDLVLVGPPPVTVPNVIALEQAAAESAIASAGLRPSEPVRSYSPTVAAGLVISQVPPARSVVASGGLVTIVLSKGPKPIRVTSYVGKTERDAKKRLRADGFKVKVTRRHGSTAKGIVAAQKPSRGKALPGAVVRIVVSLGPELVQVPDLFKIMDQYPGLDIVTPLPSIQSFINRRIASLGLTCRVTMGSDVPGGWGQTPKAGTRVPRGTVISMKILD